MTETEREGGADRKKRIKGSRRKERARIGMTEYKQQKRREREENTKTKRKRDQLGRGGKQADKQKNKEIKVQA